MTTAPIGPAHPIRLAVLGLGAVAQAVHLPLLAKRPDLFTVAAIADLSPEVTDAIGDRYAMIRDGVQPRSGLAEGRADILDCQRIVASYAARTGVPVGGEVGALIGGRLSQLVG